MRCVPPLDPQGLLDWCRVRDGHTAGDCHLLADVRLLPFPDRHQRQRSLRDGKRLSSRHHL